MTATRHLPPRGLRVLLATALTVPLLTDCGPGAATTGSPAGKAGTTSMAAPATTS